MSDLILVGTASLGLYRSLVTRFATDNPTWAPCNNGLTGTDLQIRHMSISNAHGNRAYICTDDTTDARGNMWRCDGVGESAPWQKLTLGAPAGYAFTNVSLNVDAICADPQEPDVVYAVVNYNPGVGFTQRAWIYRSEDAGETWAASAVPPYGAPDSSYVSSFSIYPGNTGRAVAMLSWVGRPRNQIVIDIADSPQWSDDGANYGIATGFILGVPNNSTDRYSYGLLGAPPGAGYLWLNRTTLIFGATTEQRMQDICSIVVEGNERVRAVTSNVNNWFRGVNDGATQAFAYATPEACASIYGVGDWYFIGKRTNGMVATGYHTLWVCNDDGATGVGSWTGASGVDPQFDAAGTSIPYTCGGVYFIGIYGLRPLGGSVPGGRLSTSTQKPVTPVTRKQSKAISIEVWNPTIASITPRGTYVGSLRRAIASYQQTRGAWLDYVSAEIGLTVSRLDAEDWIADGLLRHIETYSPEGDQIGEWFVNQVDANIGGLTITRGPLLAVGNRASVRYSEIIDQTTNPPAVGAGALTAVADNADSQSLYGIIEKVLSGGQMTAVNAAQLRDTYLAENAWPETTKELALGAGGGSVPSVTLHCLGWGEWLGVYVYNNAVAGTVTVTTKLGDILDADPNTLFSSGNANLTANPLLASESEDDDRMAMDIIKGLVSLGDNTDARYLFQVGNGRLVTYAAIPTTIEYHQRVSDKAERITTPSGTTVPPWLVEPGRWLLHTDLLVGRTPPTTALQQDPRVTFIEQVIYTAPRSVRIIGGKTGRLNQFMAQLGGYGGTSV